MRHLGVCAVFVLIAGCTGSPAARQHSLSTTLALSTASVSRLPAASRPPSVPTVPPDVPTSGPNADRDERPPVMPIAATRHTPAGARAFAVFFIKTIDWGNATVSGAYIRDLSTTSCQSCASLANGMDADRRAGRSYIGGRIRVIAVSAGRNGTLQSQIVTINSTGFEKLDRRHRYVAADPPHRRLRFEVELSWRAAHWMVKELWVDS